ncbi:nuclease-related domain-containing protein [Bacillus infantis]|uniref:nuclease-related domain-containing protein n=1 Tax=Bacillus infantis TaxID=324767 RepID=UPI00215523CD|nr:nuclease-related domain-containing protein [Bacillus infantis]MCR6611469.1 NERD domain-containing protein [Bacillus infantis]
MKKERLESTELKVLRSLGARVQLAAQDSKQLAQLLKGWNGEEEFDRWVNTIDAEWHILNDLLVSYQGTIFQVDSLIFSGTALYVFEIKNYQGDFYIQGDAWYTFSGNEIKNPVLQLRRTENLMRQLLKEHGFEVRIEANLIFVNPEFCLFQAPKNLPIILPGQMNRFREKLLNQTSPIKQSHSNLAQKLLSLHMAEDPYPRSYHYSYEKLKKGIICPHCRGFYQQIQHSFLLCGVCGERQTLEDAILGAAEEIKLLFAGTAITTPLLLDWCRIIKDRRTIQRVLMKHFRIERRGRATHYL